MNLRDSQTFRPKESDWRPRKKSDSSLLAEFPPPWGRSVFFLGPWTDWMKPIYIIIIEGNLLYSESTDLTVNAIPPKILFTEVSRITFDYISGYLGLAKLTHKSNHLTHTKVCPLNWASLLVSQELLLICSILALLLFLSYLHVSPLWLLSRPLCQAFCLFCSTLTPRLHYCHLLRLTSTPPTPNNSPFHAHTNFTHLVACNAFLP